MSENEIGDLYREGVESAGTDPNDCPRPERLEALVAKAGSEAERMTTLDHVMSCESCRKEFELLRAISAAQREEEGAPSSSRIPLALAASLVGLVAAGTVWQMSRTPDAVLRGGADSVRVVEPVGSVDALSLVRWTGAGEDAQFELVLSDLSGMPFFDTTTTDTLVALPDGLELPEDGAGLIQLAVTTLTEGRVALSPVEFRVRQ